MSQDFQRVVLMIPQELMDELVPYQRRRGINSLPALLLELIASDLERKKAESHRLYP